VIVPLSDNQVRINLNLGRSENPFERYMLVWALPALVVAGLFLGRGLYFGTQDFLHVRRVEKSILEYQGQISILKDKADRAQRLLAGPSTRELERKADFLNSLIDQKRVSLSEMTLKMTQFLPDEARLSDLAVVPTKTNPVVQVSVEGRTEDAVDTFLANLEQSPDFSKVVVTSQAFEKPGPQGSLVALKCTANYVGSQMQ
jgi:Tfp pilus assembly protein PilN